MKRFRYVFLVMIIMGVSSCAAPAAPQESPTEEAVEENTPVPTQAEISEPEEEPEVVDHCVDCHTEKEHLVDTAKPIVEIVSENEGAG